MDILAAVARVVLVGVFLLSGIAKIRDQPGTRRAVRDFGIPSSVRRLAAIALPLTELALAALLVSNVTAWWGALGSLGLFMVFACAIGYQLLRNRKFDCHCFGNIGAGPIGPVTLIRAIVLAAVALVVILQGWKDVQPVLERILDTLLSAYGAIILLLLVSIGLMIATFWGLLYAFRMLRSQVSYIASQYATQEAPSQTRGSLNSVPPKVGDPAPVLELPDLNGNVVDFSTFLGKKTLLVFVKPGCWACEDLVPELISWESKRPSVDFRMVVVSRGSVEENAHLVGLRSTVVLAPDAHVAQAFGTGGTPAAVYLGTDGAVASEAVLGTPSVMALLNPVVADAQRGSIVQDMRRKALQSTHRLANVLRGGSAST